MIVITITRDAKCKDCKFCKVFMKGRLLRHKCTNIESHRNKYETIRLNDLVCDKWQF